MRDPIAFEFIGQTNADGTAAEFIPGLPSRRIPRSEFDAMTDPEKAALHTSPLHKAYGHADEEAAQAAESLSQDDAAPVAPSDAVSADKPPKAEAKK